MYDVHNGVGVMYQNVLGKKLQFATTINITTPVVYSACVSQVKDSDQISVSMVTDMLTRAQKLDDKVTRPKGQHTFNIFLGNRSNCDTLSAFNQIDGPTDIHLN